MNLLRRLLPLVALLLALGPGPGAAEAMSQARAVDEAPVLRQASLNPAAFLGETLRSLDALTDGHSGGRLDGTREMQRLAASRHGTLPRLGAHQIRILARNHPGIPPRTGYCAARSSAVPPPSR